ncbi:MAG: response regulator transcription factor [Planctomycetota bacterium]
MRSLLVIEDDAGIRQSLVDFFEVRDWLVRPAPDLGAARAALAEGAYSAILLDLLLPDGDGLDLLEELRGRPDDTPVLVLTARGEERQRIRGLELGADDYVVKPFSAYELSARLEAVLRRTGTRNTLVGLGTVEVDLEALEVRRDGEALPLLPKEADLLRYLLRNAGRTVGRDAILREVWGYDSLPATRTVDTHVYELRKKLEQDPRRPRFLLTVHGVGYRLRTDPDEDGRGP